MIWLLQVRQHVLGVPEHGAGYFALDMLCKVGSATERLCGSITHSIPMDFCLRENDGIYARHPLGKPRQSVLSLASYTLISIERASTQEIR